MHNLKRYFCKIIHNKRYKAQCFIMLSILFLFSFKYCLIYSFIDRILLHILLILKSCNSLIMYYSGNCLIVKNTEKIHLNFLHFLQPFVAVSTNCSNGEFKFIKWFYELFKQPLAVIKWIYIKTLKCNWIKPI